MNRVPDLPPTPRSWRIRARAEGDGHLLPFTGWIVRGAMGRCLREAVCSAPDAACPCDRLDCPYPPAFEGGGQPTPFSLDASDLDGRVLQPGDPVEVRICTLRDDSARALVQALAHALEEGIGSPPIPFRIEGVEGGEAVDPLRRGEALGPSLLVVLRTPTRILRAGEPLVRPTPRDLLHGVLHRARNAGIPTAHLPRFDGAIQGVRLWSDHGDGRRWSARRGAWVPYEGVRGAWNLEIRPCHAPWLALAEAIGVGTGTGMGMGVLRCGLGGRGG